MTSTVTFQNTNFGMQTGINNGTINAHFLHADPLDRLPIAYGAVFDSYTNQHQEECLPGTRSELLSEIAEWAMSPEGKCIFWLNGMAGTGKSTISRTVAKRFEEEKILGASFFFKRGQGDRGNAIKLFPTIARQLAKTVPRLIPGINKAIDNNSDIGNKGLKEQFDKILLQPLLDLDSPALSIPNVVIIMDALDECDADLDIRLILQLLPQLQNSKAIRLRVLLTSRPELPIRLGFKKLATQDHKDLVLHEIPKEVIEHDLSLFLNYRLSEIRKEREPPLPINWPGAENIRKLVALSTPLFIFAATICRIFEDPDWDPVDSLLEILTHQKDESKLDGTYLPVLDRLLDRQTEKKRKELVQEFHQVVGAIVILESPLSVTSLSKLIGLPERLIHLRLNPLHSVLSVPNDEALPVQLFHLSFRDFLLDSATREKTPLWVDEKEAHYRLATQCLNVCQNLKKNLCGLRSDGTKQVEIDQQTVNECLPPPLQYACRYWAHHLVRSKDQHTAMHKALLFLQVHCLHWMEAMSILGCLSDVLETIGLLQKAANENTDTALSEILYDAKRFLLKNRQIANDAPLQLYCSGIMFTPRTAVFRKLFAAELPSWVCQFPQVDETWGSELQTLEGHSGMVQSVAFSPNGRLLASGSEDDIVRLWDTATGALQQTLEGHSNGVWSVAFSPDGQLLASSSEDETVRLWDIATGTLQQILKGHSNGVYSVAFSPDGRLLASGGCDDIVRLWDAATGALQQTLEGHSSSVNSVSFSPDGRLLASGSFDKTVRLWDMATGTLQQTLEGHSDWVWAVSFSPGGRLLVSSSRDRIVRLWDTVTGALQQTFEGSLDSVDSVAFSPDGYRLASSSNNIVRLWDTATGTHQQVLEGHSRTVCSVAFSPDGWLLASGSFDKTVRLWDIGTGALQQSLGIYSVPVYSVAFSDDGRLLASGSRDGIVRLWDPTTGALLQTLKGHLDSVNLVAFSPDGRLLASGSRDRTVRLWDTTTGALQQTLKGHLNSVNLVAFSHDGGLLASGSWDTTAWPWGTAAGALQQNLKGHSYLLDSVAFLSDGQLLASHPRDKTVQLWDTMTGALQQTLESHSGSVNSLAFSPDGQLLASGSFDNTVRLWDTATGGLHTAEGHSHHSHWVWSVAFSPDSRLLASGSRDRTVRLWDPATGTLQHTLEGHSDSVGSVTFSPDGYQLASSSSDKTVRLWNTVTGGLQQTLESHSGPVYSVAFSLDGRLLASASSDRTVRLWETATGALQQTIESHLGPVYSVAFSLDGRLLASASHDRTVRLWDTATGALQQTFESHSGPVYSVAFSPNSQLLATGSHDRTVRLWDMATGTLQHTLEGHSDSVDSVAFSPNGQVLASSSNDKIVRLWDTATGTLQQTWIADGTVTNLECFQTDLCVCTDLRALGIQTKCDSSLAKVNPEISIEHGQWVKLNGEKFLWLPPEYRPSHYAINGSILALAHVSGRVSFIEFRV